MKTQYAGLKQCSDTEYCNLNLLTYQQSLNIIKMGGRIQILDYMSLVVNYFLVDCFDEKTLWMCHLSVHYQPLLRDIHSSLAMLYLFSIAKILQQNSFLSGKVLLLQRQISCRILIRPRFSKKVKDRSDITWINTVFVRPAIVNISSDQPMGLPAPLIFSSWFTMNQAV